MFKWSNDESVLKTQFFSFQSFSGPDQFSNFQIIKLSNFQIIKSSIFSRQIDRSADAVFICSGHRAGNVSFARYPQITHIGHQ